MAQRDERQRDERNPRDDQRDHPRHQMDQYADHSRQHGGPYGSDRDLSRADPAQASYGRAGAPDVHGRPSGGYQRDHQADAGYNRPGYLQNQNGREGGRHDDERGGYGYGGPQQGNWGRSSGGYDDQRQAFGSQRHDEGRDGDRQRHQNDERSDYGRFQGGAGGPRSNAGVYAGSQTYGGYGDQLGYGSYDDGRHPQQHHDPDYLQWRQQQMRSLDEDYQTWRGERYQKFSDEFSTWRQGRSTQGGAPKADASDPNAKPGGGKDGGSGSK